ncbi:unnamed protein product [Cylindrotheca closterium]|uniref:Glutathionylspermidine synthase pre-ATP-grasp-like domain-containing protein n=1 Tax=Cylindrotheca closterium TaxID=2856 RepID=A0AAD2G652_9STRA|nr:unnamed protein product [Cylindrotheca closterium]
MIRSRLSSKLKVRNHHRVTISRHAHTKPITLLRPLFASTTRKTGIRWKNQHAQRLSSLKKTDKEPKNDESNLSAFGALAGFLLFIAAAVYLRSEFEDWDEEEEVDDTPIYLSRKKEIPRSNWKETFEKIGFPFGDYPGVPSGSFFGESEHYWNEKASYHVHPFGRWMLESAAFQIHSMCLEAANEVIGSDDLLEKFEIPRDLWEAIRVSWNARQTDIGGRMDLLWDGTTPPKLAEYNADTPTVLIESAIAQENWFQEVYGSPGEGKLNDKNDFTQFNVIKFAMEEAFERIKRKNPGASIIFTTNAKSPESEFLEERSTSVFMQNCAKLAGLPTEFVDIEDLDEPVLFENLLKASSNEKKGNFNTDVSTTTASLFIWKLYPYEWLVQEKLGLALTNHAFLHGNLKWLEPPWKLVLSSKAMLAYLWEKHKGHPNLLPTYWNLNQVQKVRQTNTKDGWVAKPRFGREGIGIMYSDDYNSWGEFATMITNTSQSIDVSCAVKFDPTFSDWNSNSSKTLISYLEDNNGGSGGPSLKSLLKYVKPYIGSFDKDSVETLRERDWGSVHSKEESPTFGYFLGKPIFQKYHRPARLDGRTAVTSAWIVNGLPVGICFREDKAITTNDDSCFVPHVVTKGAAAVKPGDKFNFVYPITPIQKQLREELYGINAVGSGSNAKMTYEEYLGVMGNQPVGVSESGGGGDVRSGYFYGVGNRRYGGSSSSIRWWSWARGDENGSKKPNEKSSASAGSKGTQAASKASTSRLEQLPEEHLPGGAAEEVDERVS